MLNRNSEFEGLSAGFYDFDIEHISITRPTHATQRLFLS